MLKMLIFVFLWFFSSNSFCSGCGKVFSDEVLYRGVSLTNEQKEVVTKMQNAKNSSLLHSRGSSVVFSILDIAALKQAGLSLKDVEKLLKSRLAKLERSFYLEDGLGGDLWSQWKRFKTMAAKMKKLLKQSEELNVQQIKDIAFISGVYSTIYHTARPHKTRVSDMEWLLQELNKRGFVTEKAIKLLIDSKIFLILHEENSLNHEFFNYISDKDAAQSAMGKVLTSDQNDALQLVQDALFSLNKFKSSLLLDSGLTMKDIQILFRHNILTKDQQQKKSIRNRFPKLILLEEKKKLKKGVRGVKLDFFL